MNRIADLVLMYENKIVEAIDLSKEDTPKTGNSSAHLISDPTAQKALHRVAPPETVYIEFGPRVAGKCSVFCLKKPACWLEACKHTWSHYKERPKEHRLMELRYKQGVTDTRGIARELDISQQRVYVLLDLIHRFLLDYASGMGATVLNQERAERVTDILRTLKEKR